jgi:uncharacterized protein with GYD domain
MLAKPENREEAVSKLFESVGGRLIGWYLTFGHHDWLVIGEFPDEKAAASAILAAAAGGSLSEIETTVAMTAKDAHATFVSAPLAPLGGSRSHRISEASLARHATGPAPYDPNFLLNARKLDAWTGPPEAQKVRPF